MKAALLALAASLACLSGPVRASDDAVYLIAQVQITDQTGYFETYGAKVGPLLQKAGAQILVATPARQTLEGEWLGNWTVVIKFASEADALNWYNSDAYRTIRPMRLRSTSANNLILAPAFVPPLE